MDKKTLYFVLAAAGSQFFTFAGLFLYTSILSPAQYATVAIFEVILFFLQAFIGLSLNTAAQRFYVDYDGEYIIGIASSGSLFLSVILLFLFSIISIFVPILNYIGVSYSEFMALYVAATGYLLHAIALVKYQFSQQPKLYFLTSISKTACFFLFSAAFLIYFDFYQNAYVYASLITGVATLILSMFITKPILLKEKHKDLLKEMLTYSIPFVPTLIAAWVMTWSNRLFMIDEVNAIDVGVFSAAQRIGMVFFVFTQAISLVATPILFFKLKSGSKDECRLLINLYLSGHLLVASMIVLFLPDFLEHLLGVDYQGIDFLISVVMFVNFINALMGISTNILFNFYKKTFLQMKVFLSCALLSLLLNAFLIPIFKLEAVLFNMVVTTVVLLFLHLYFCKVTTGFILSYRYLLTLIVTFFIVCMAGQVLKLLFTNYLVVIGVEIFICFCICLSVTYSFFRNLNILKR